MRLRKEPGIKSKIEMSPDADAYYMRRALGLARLGAGLVSPNPMVGAVIVKDGRIVGEGYHRYEQVSHAETIAIEMAGSQTRGATVYCSLEPCSHYGRTPPCADALVEAGISRAVIATTDSDLRVSGRGIERLRQAGIQVEIGLFEREARRINEIYFESAATGLPFVHRVISLNESEYEPPKALLKLALRYDAVLLGHFKRLNDIVVENCLSFARHRPLVIVGANRELEQMGQLEGNAEYETILVEEDATVFSVLQIMAERRMTSLLALVQRDESRFGDLGRYTNRVTTVAARRRN